MYKISKAYEMEKPIVKNIFKTIIALKEVVF